MDLLKDPHFAIRSAAARLLPRFIFIDGMQVAKEGLPEYVQAVSKEGGGCQNGEAVFKGGANEISGISKTWTVPDDDADTQVQFTVGLSLGAGDAMKPECLNEQPTPVTDGNKENIKADVTFGLSPAVSTYAFPNALSMSISATDGKGTITILGYKIDKANVLTGVSGGTVAKFFGDAAVTGMKAVAANNQAQATDGDTLAHLAPKTVLGTIEAHSAGLCATDIDDATSRGSKQSGASEANKWTKKIVSHAHAILTPLYIIIVVEMFIEAELGFTNTVMRSGKNVDDKGKPKPILGRGTDVTQTCQSDKTGNTGFFGLVEPYAKLSLGIELSISVVIIRVGIGGTVFSARCQTHLLA